jgi:serine/threonine protein kinase
MTEKQEPSSPRHARLRLGTTLNAKYRLDRLLGVGGMASVYAATHRNGSRVAVKMLHGPLSLDADIRRRFLREGYVANKVDHPGAVQVIDDDEAEDGTAFLVMELLKGESLDVRWDRQSRRMPVAEVLAITYELLDTLSAAHANGIVHRDIKPANLFLSTDGKLKVLDFGIARLLEVTSGHAHTHTGRAVGTPAFMPPEQALGKTRDIDGQTDLWAVGATMFTLISGCDVHEAENVSEQLIFAATKPARSLAVVAPEVPPAVIQVVDRALSFERSGRWSDARAMRDALAEAHRLAWGQSIAESILLLGSPLAEPEESSSDSLGPIGSESPRAFAPTVASTHEPSTGEQISARTKRPSEAPASGAKATVPSTKVQPSLRGQPTTGGGSFSVERGPTSLALHTLVSPMAVRKRWLGIGVGGAVTAVLVAVSFYGYDAPKRTVLAPTSPISNGRASDEVTAIPIRLPEAPSSVPVPVPETMPALATPSLPKSAPPHAVAATSGSPTIVKSAEPVRPRAGADAPAASATAAQGGVVVTVPY